MKLLFISLGCDKNLVDTEFMLGMIRDAGTFDGQPIEMTDDEYQADIIIINTCCFINDAKEESINTILEMAEHKRDAKLKALIVTGCLAQRYKEEIRKEIPEVDAILGTNSYEDIVNAITEALGGKFYENFETLEGLPKLTAKRSVTTGGHFAYLKIAEGCNKRCTYCIIPYARGRVRQLPQCSDGGAGGTGEGAGGGRREGTDFSGAGDDALRRGSLRGEVPPQAAGCVK